MIDSCATVTPITHARTAIRAALLTAVRRHAPAAVDDSRLAEALVGALVEKWDAIEHVRAGRDLETLVAWFCGASRERVRRVRRA
jgi:hypothetical protein